MKEIIFATNLSITIFYNNLVNKYCNKLCLVYMHMQLQLQCLSAKVILHTKLCAKIFM